MSSKCAFAINKNPPNVAGVVGGAVIDKAANFNLLSISRRSAREGFLLCGSDLCEIVSGFREQFG